MVIRTDSAGAAADSMSPMRRRRREELVDRYVTPAAGGTTPGCCGIMLLPLTPSAGDVYIAAPMDGDERGR